jgi:hypothetical protein
MADLLWHVPCAGVKREHASEEADADGSAETKRVCASAQEEPPASVALPQRPSAAMSAATAVHAEPQPPPASAQQELGVRDSESMDQAAPEAYDLHSQLKALEELARQRVRLLFQR